MRAPGSLGEEPKSGKAAWVAPPSQPLPAWVAPKPGKAACVAPKHGKAAWVADSELVLAVAHMPF